MINSTLFIAYKFSKIKKNMPLYTAIYSVAIFSISFALTSLLTITIIMNQVHKSINEELVNIYPLVTINNINFDDFINFESNIEYDLYEFSQSPIIISRGSNESYGLLRTFNSNDSFLPNTINFLDGMPQNLVNNTIIINESQARKLNVLLGDRVLASTGESLDNLNQRLLTVVGIVEDNVLYNNIVNVDTFNSLSRENVSQIGLETHNLSETDVLVSDIKRQFLNANIRSWVDISPRLSEAIKFEKVAITTATLILVIMASLTIFALITAMGIKRTRDISILRLIGVRRKQIFFIFILQALFISIITSIITFLLSWFLLLNMDFIFTQISFYLEADLSSLLRLDESIMNFEMDFNVLFNTLFLNFIISFFSAVIPSYIIAKMNTGEALKYE